VVDDEVEITRSLYDLFRRDYAVITANSAADALEHLRRRSIQIVLTDQRMPGLTGAELLARVRELSPDTVRLMMTGYADIAAVVDAINRGNVFRYISKPWNPDELRAVLSQAAAQYDLLAERRRLVAELSQANGELRRNGELLTAFLEMAGHELRTPITVIQGLSELLARGGPADAQPISTIRPKLERIAANARRLGSIAESMLKSVAGRTFPMELRLETFDPAALVDEVCEEYAPFLRSRNLTLDRPAGPPPPPIHADRGKVRDVLANLLSNAIRFTPDGGLVSVSVAPAPEGPDRIRIEVADTGAGVAEADRPNVFRPFYGTADTSRHTSAGAGLEYGKRGPGLGLTIVRRFTELHGGTVELLPEPGGGSRFRVVLPVTARPPGRHHEPPPSG
jgi:signal transduction histidine kinase